MNGDAGRRTRGSGRGAARAGMAAVLAAAALAAGCAGPPEPPARAVTWLAARPMPAFDPGAPPDPLRESLERLLTRGLVERDSSGAAVPGAAERWSVSEDGLTWTFTLRAGLAFTDGAPCSSAHFARAIASALARQDHGTAVWALGAVRGVEAIRPRRPLPALGLETPDARTLILRLARAEPRLAERLALPGLAAAWRSLAPARGWEEAVGLGPYRVARAEEARLTLLRADGTPPGRVADTLRVRFAPGAARVRAAMRAGSVDVVWPLPPGLLEEPLPPGWAAWSGPSDPPRRLTLVMREDTPPTSRLAARRALAHGLNRPDLLRALGLHSTMEVRWLDGAPPFTFPSLDAREVHAWLERGRLGRSFHVAMAYDADGAGAEIARRMQGEWARFGLYVELMPLRGQALATELLSGWRSHLALVEATPLGRGEDGLSTVVHPLRGPAVGSFRTAWRTREFDAWLAPRGERPPFDAAAAQRRLEDELVVLPLARLDWRMAAREDAPRPALDPAFGPDFRVAPDGAGWSRIPGR